MKDKMKKITFGRVLGVIAVVCLLWVSIMLTIAFSERNESDEVLVDIYSSECRSFVCDGEYSIKNMSTGKTTIDGIDWLFAAEAYADSLVVYSKNLKRGYFDRYTGENVIPAQYTHAWIFSEGLAAVVLNDKVGFIDHHGKIVIDFQFPYIKDNKKQIGLVFHDGYCSMYDETGKCGMINKKGEWVLKPSYEYIRNPQYGKRIFNDGEMFGVLDDSLHVLLPAEYKDIALEDNYLVADRSDGIQLQISYNGEVLNKNIYHDVTSLDYDTMERRADSGEAIMKPTGMYYYGAYNLYGLMDDKGKPLTPAIYADITALSKELFLCSLKDRYSKVIMNRKGQVIRYESDDLQPL